MIGLVKAEFRKLFTIRSTYFMVGVAFAMVILFAFYVEGIRAIGPVTDTGKLASEVTNAISVVSIFFAVIALLLMSHEYRHNTIMYTLTSSNSRTKTLLSKIIVVSVFAVGFSILIGVFSPLMTYLGLQIKGYELVPQTLHYGDLLWKTVYTGWANGMAGLLFATLLRNQVAAMAVFFILPGPIESLLGLLLKGNAAYLPFSALHQVATNSGAPPPHEAGITLLSPGKGALVFMVYLVIGWVIAWILFLRRDAN